MHNKTEEKKIIEKPKTFVNKELRQTSLSNQPLQENKMFNFIEKNTENFIRDVGSAILSSLTLAPLEKWKCHYTYDGYRLRTAFKKTISLEVKDKQALKSGYENSVKGGLLKSANARYMQPEKQSQRLNSEEGSVEQQASSTMLSKAVKDGIVVFNLSFLDAALTHYYSNQALFSRIGKETVFTYRKNSCQKKAYLQPLEINSRKAAARIMSQGFLARAFLRNFGNMGGVALSATVMSTEVNKFIPANQYPLSRRVVSSISGALVVLPITQIGGILYNQKVRSIATDKPPYYGVSYSKIYRDAYYSIDGLTLFTRPPTEREIGICKLYLYPKNGSLASGTDLDLEMAFYSEKGIKRMPFPMEKLSKDSQICLRNNFQKGFGKIRKTAQKFLRNPHEIEANIYNDVQAEIHKVIKCDYGRIMGNLFWKRGAVLSLAYMAIANYTVITATEISAQGMKKVKKGIKEAKRELQDVNLGGGFYGKLQKTYEHFSFFARNSKNKNNYSVKQQGYPLVTSPFKEEGIIEEQSQVSVRA